MPGNGVGNAAGFGAVTFDFNPGPDSRDRLRRLFSLLLEHAATQGQIPCGEGHSREGNPEWEPANGGKPVDRPRQMPVAEAL